MSDSRYIIGIDPGVQPGIAVLHDDGRFYTGCQLSGNGRVVVSDLVDYLRPFQPAMVVIERVHAMPRQGVASTFKFGRALGAIEGAIEASGWPSTDVAPHVWKGKLALPKDDKDGSRQFAQRRWPGHDEWRAKGKGQAIADAACIALAWIERKP